MTVSVTVAFSGPEEGLTAASAGVWLTMVSVRTLERRFPSFTTQNS